jgi:methyl-accepting chemotaxis protein
MTQYTPWWRRRFYVHPIQRKYFFLSVAPLVLCAFLLILLIFLPLDLTLRGPAPDPEKVATAGQMYALAIRIWPAIFISMLVSCLLSFFVTNKFAGPLSRIEQVVQKIAEGDLPRSIRVRRRDDLQGFSGLLDRAFGKITWALSAIREHEALAAKELAALQERLNAGLDDVGKIQQGLEVVSRHHREVENILANFRLPIRSGEEDREGRTDRDRGGLPSVPSLN